MSIPEKTAVTPIKAGKPSGDSFRRTRALAQSGIETAEQAGKLISALTADYTEESEQLDPKVILSAIGKRINLESLKLRAAVLTMKTNGKGKANRFFLTN